MALKRNFSIPSTVGRLVQSAEFSGYIYPQFITAMIGFNALPSGTDSLGASALNQLNQNVSSQAVGNILLSSQNMSAIAGIKSFTKNYNREVFKRKQLGNYEYLQSIPGTIGVTLSIEKVIFYNNANNVSNNNISSLIDLDNILDINYDGAIKQTAPIMLVENLRDPKGNLKTIMYMDCWVKSSKISYNLSGDTLVVNSMAIECTKVFLPSDTFSDVSTLAIEGLGLVDQTTNAIDFQFNSINPL
jgi:hypothetical protein